jgi:hypothetical protein
MWAFVIIASETFFGLSFFYPCRKNRKLLSQFAAAAMGAFSLPFTGAIFQQFGYFSAIIALIFVNRHLFPHL